MADLTFLSYNNANSRYYGKKIAVCVGASDLLPVIKMNNVDYSGQVISYEPGQYAILMCSQAIAEPTVNDIDSILFPSCDGSSGTNLLFGIESFIESDQGDVLFQGEEITETSQLITVGAHDGVATVSSGEALVTMQAGFAADFFE